MKVGDILAISMNPTEILKIMEGKTVKYNNGKIAPPEMYLEENLRRKLLMDACAGLLPVMIM